MSKVSFILPAYKGLFLRESILSILDQKYSNFELVIVNDKSPDDIKGIVSSFNDSRIKYYENEKNIGEEDLVANWNLCLSYATGKWGVLASDDDIYEKTFLSELIQLVEKYPHIDLVHCRHRIINGDGDVLGFSEPCLEFECAEEFIFHNIIRRRRQVAPNFMFRISALREIDGFVNLPMAWGSDDATWCKLALGGGVIYTGSVLFSWRSSGINISSQVRNQFDKAKTRLLLFDYFEKEILSYFRNESELSNFFGRIVNASLHKAIAGEIVYTISNSRSIKTLSKIYLDKELSRFLGIGFKAKLVFYFLYLKLNKRLS